MKVTAVQGLARPRTTTVLSRLTSDSHDVDRATTFETELSHRKQLETIEMVPSRMQ